MISHPFCESATVTVRVDSAMGFKKRTDGMFKLTHFENSVRKNVAQGYFYYFLKYWAS